MKTVSRGEELRKAKQWSTVLPEEEQRFIAAISHRHGVDRGVVAMAYYCGLTAPSRIQARRQQILENDITRPSKIELAHMMPDSILRLVKDN